MYWTRIRRYYSIPKSTTPWQRRLQHGKRGTCFTLILRAHSNVIVEYEPIRIPIRIPLPLISPSPSIQTPAIASTSKPYHHHIDYTEMQIPGDLRSWCNHTTRCCATDMGQPWIMRSKDASRPETATKDKNNICFERYWWDDENVEFIDISSGRGRSADFEKMGIMEGGCSLQECGEDVRDVGVDIIKSCVTRCYRSSLWTYSHKADIACFMQMPSPS